ncbi:MAG: hypothetical protein ACLRNV_02710 [Flavonifractor plautii]
MVITVEEARAYSRDYESTDEEMAALIEVAESMIDDGIRGQRAHGGCERQGDRHHQGRGGRLSGENLW